jgi:hypothetical protein
MNATRMTAAGALLIAMLFWVGPMPAPMTAVGCAA